MAPTKSLLACLLLALVLATALALPEQQPEDANTAGAPFGRRLSFFFKHHLNYKFDKHYDYYKKSHGYYKKSHSYYKYEDDCHYVCYDRYHKECDCNKHHAYKKKKC